MVEHGTTGTRRPFVPCTHIRRVGILFALGSALLLGESFVETKPVAASLVTATTSADGSRTVTLLDLSVWPSVLQRALEDAGVDNVTSMVTTGPSRVGTIVSLGVAAPADATSVVARGRTLVIPAGYRGTVRLTVGVAAPPGAAYEQPSSPFTAGEPLNDVPDDGDVATLTAAARAQGVTPIVTDMSGTVVGEVATGVKPVVVFMRSANELVIRVESPS